MLEEIRDGTASRVTKLRRFPTLVCDVPLMCKVVSNSLAAIQGKDCLVQKFRNSSVMLETPHYRPKVSLSFALL